MRWPVITSLAIIAMLSMRLELGDPGRAVTSGTISWYTRNRITGTSIVTRAWSGGLIFVVLLLLCRCLLIAQAVFGTVDGTVFDISGSACAGASVTINDRDRGAIYRTTSNPDGSFSQT